MDMERFEPMESRHFKSNAGATFTVQPMTPNVGAEVTDLDLSAELDDGTISDIVQVLGEYGVLFFRNQSITPADHLALARRFGDININKFFYHVDGFPEIANVQRKPDERGATGWYWHTDHSYDENPAMGSIFVARELPPVGGDTLFASTYAPYDALSDGMKSVLDGLWAWHSDLVCPEVSQPSLHEDFGGRLKLLDTPGTRARHPVVIRHPISGRKSLYINPGFTEGIDGWTVEESKPLLDFLYSHIGQPQFTYRHRWRSDDVAFWDNRATWHCALDDCFGHSRILHRITIEGESLQPAAGRAA